MKGKGGFRKVNIFLLLLIILCAILIGYYVAAGAEEGVTFFAWYENIKRVMEHPFRWYYNQYTLRCIGVSLFIFFFLIVYYICSAKNFRFGEEQGSARFGDVKKENKLLSDPNTKKTDSQNIIVTKKRLLKEKEYVINPRERMISEHLHMSMDTKHTDLNNNVFIIGGSGAGKTFRWVKPNIMQMVGSYIITDPKGEILRSSAGFLKKHGYVIKVIDVRDAKEMKKSTRYNPFHYITSNDDIIKLVAMYMDATKEKDSQSGDQYWTDMASLLLEACVYYVYYEGVEIRGVLHKDFAAVMYLANMVKVEETSQGARKKTELDRMFGVLHPEHPALLAYNKVMEGAADTVRSIISTFHSRLKRMQSDSILELLSSDEMDIKKIGLRKTAVFCVIPDNDKTYNFVISMLYDQMFKQMYYQADHIYKGSLPVPVTFLLDEFANVALPDNFLSLLSTMRSRNISSVIIIQNLAQIKKMYKEEEWESIPGNCDTVVYLGGNEASTHKWIAELLGKETIDKRSSSESKGKQGSLSISSDIMQRELMYADEIRKMSRKKCLVIINGKDAIFDDKIKTLQHPLWKQYTKESKDYQFDGRLERMLGGQVTVLETGEKEKATIQVHDVVEVELLEQEDKINQEEYEEECCVAKIIGKELPEKPQKHIMEISLEELIWLSEHEYELKSPIEEKIGNMQENTNKEELIQNIETIAGDEENKFRDIVLDSDVDYETSSEKEEQIGHPDTMDNKIQALKAQAFGKLSMAGYSSEQIALLLPLIEPKYGYTSEMIPEIFSKAYNLETMRVMISMLGK